MERGSAERYLAIYYRVPQKYRSKVPGSEGHFKGTKANFNPVHVGLHFGTFVFVVLQLILASKLSELEQFGNFAANNQFRKID